MQSKDRGWVQEACVYDPAQSFKTQDPSNPVTEVSQWAYRQSLRRWLAILKGVSGQEVGSSSTPVLK